MAQIDRFIRSMLGKPGSELFMAADSPPTLRLNGESTPLMNKKPTASQVRHLVGEVTPKPAQKDLKASGQARFVYDGAGDPVEIEIRNWSGATAFVVRSATQTPDSLGAGLEMGIPKAHEPSLHPLEGSLDSGVDLSDGSLELEPPIAAVASTPEAPSAPAPAPTPATKTKTKSVAAGAERQIIGGPDKPIDRLFRIMVKEGASDLHMTSEEVPMLRKDGDMVRIEDMGKIGPDKMMELLLPIMPDDNQLQFEQENDSDFAYEIKNLARFRANVFRDRMGPGAVFRTIPADILTAEQLNLSKPIQDLAHLHKGLVLVTGPTGSGKSTTLAALIDLVNRVRSGHIITIEDPIEFVHPNKQCLVNQREVGVHTDSFKRALRAALREDPDIILVGELRDLETISIAIETAETGHLVFGTLHTTTAYSTVDRVIDQFPPDRQEQIRVMLSESLKAVISQTLCKKLGGGRVAALEVLLANTAVANLIREGKTFQIPSIMQTGKKQGMVLLNEAMVNLVKSGQVSPEEAMAKAVDKSLLKTMFTQNNIKVSGES